jgi:DNA-directed RNA polymerase subunit omega
MARITVEDCLHNCENRFELTRLAAKRARQLALGKDDPKVEINDDKPTVIALREIAGNLINPEYVDEIDKRPVEPVTVIASAVSEDEDFLD